MTFNSFAPIADRLGKLIPMLSSDQEGEVIAVAAIDRPDGQELIVSVRRLFEQDQARSWRDQIEITATEQTSASS